MLIIEATVTITDPPPGPADANFGEFWIDGMPAPFGEATTGAGFGEFWADGLPFEDVP